MGMALPTLGNRLPNHGRSPFLIELIAVAGLF
jgi:hypothetical protein